MEERKIDLVVPIKRTILEKGQKIAVLALPTPRATLTKLRQRLSNVPQPSQRGEPR